MGLARTVVARRSVRRSFARAQLPGLPVSRCLSLAIGIGANCAIFSFADALLLRPLPVARPGDVFTVGSNSSLEAFGINSLVSSYRDYVDIRDRAKSFDGLVAFRYVTAGVATDPNATPRLRMGVMASGNLFAVMGVEPTIGRSFRPEEDQVPGRDAVVVLGRTMWEQEFGSDPGVLGPTLRLNGQPFTVIGVAPPGFTGLDQFVRSDFFVPVMMAPRLINDPQDRSLEARDARNLTLKGRLKRGVSQASAQSELTAIAADLERAYPDTNRNRRFMIRTELQSRIAEDPPDAMLTAMLVHARACRAARRMRERRGVVDQPRAGPRPRDGAASRDRRRTRPARPPIGHRKPADRSRGRSPGPRRRLRRHDALPADRDTDGSTRSR